MYNNYISSRKEEGQRRGVKLRLLLLLLLVLLKWEKSMCRHGKYSNREIFCCETPVSL